MLLPVATPGALPKEVRTLSDLLQWRAANHGALPLFRYLHEGVADGPEEVWTIADVDRRARQVAAALAPHAPPGSRALLLFPPGLDFIAAFFGCVYAGVVAVPVAPPDPTRLEATLPRLRGVVRDANPAVLLSVSAFATFSEGLAELAPELAALPAIAVDEVRSETSWSPRSVAPEDLAFLQYTSGSTGDPKGVMVSHRNVLANEENIDAAFTVRPGDLGVSWLPMFHDMGLLAALIQPLAVMVPVVILSPLAFLQRPLSWLQTVSRLKATVTGAPNFAYELCARRVTPEVLETLDLRSWRLAFCGAEPVRPATLERFARTFAPCGFDPRALYPTYGLAEATLLVSGPKSGSGMTSVSFDPESLSSGRPVPSGAGRALASCGQVIGQEARIVSADGQALPPGQVGEIWLRGPNVTGGYWQRPEESREIFGATLAQGDGPWLRTGDLGFFHQEGLYLCGRKKDVIIVRGRNLYPQDLEHSVERAHPALRAGCSAAFSVDDGTVERLVVVAEANETPELPAAFAAMRRAVADEHGAELHAIALIRPRTIPKTSSGKIRRRSCREAWLAGELELIAQEGSPPKVVPAPAAPGMKAEAEEGRVLPWMMDWLRRHTANPSIQPDMGFSEAGLDSLAATQLAGDLERHLGFEVPMELFFGTRIDQTAALLEHGQRSIGGGARVDLERDATLEPELVPRGTPRASEGAPILLTGATGFLGGFLLRELLSQTSSPIVCLVRAASPEVALERVRDNVARYGPIAADALARVSVVVGDLARPRFGLEPERFEALSREVGSILHCGAVVHWGYGYSSLKDSNVGGTREVVRLSCLGGGLPIHHVSSVGVYPFGEVTQEQFPEQDELKDGELLQIPYFQSKWVAERMLEHARARGVPVAIYRPGFVSGDSRTGAESASESQLFYAFLAGCVKLGEVPAVEKVIDVVPVDYVARALVTMMRDPRALGRKFNFINPQPFRQRDVYAALRGMGYSLQEIAYPRWREKVLALRSEEENPLGRFTIYYRKLTETRMARVELQMVRRMPVEDANTRELLAGTGVECPAFEVRLLRTYVDWYARRGLLPPPLSAMTEAQPVPAPLPAAEAPLLLEKLVASDARLMQLYEKGKDRQWNATHRIDWSLELDPENPQDLPDAAIPIYGSDLFRKMNKAERARLRHHFQAWQLSQFMHGEQGALLCAAKIVQQCPNVEGRLYAATQVVDEARHLEVFTRLLHEKFQLSFPIVAPLKRLLDDILRDARWDMTCLGMQVLVEGLALAAFAVTRDHSRNPLAASVNAYVMEDEARHVAFGRLSLEDYYRELSPSELKVREEFVVEASYLLRDRFQAADVWESLGLPAATCAAWMRESGFHRNWQAQLFTRIVPTIRAIGLWGPRVRDAYAQMGVLPMGNLDVEAMQHDDERIAQEMLARMKGAGQP